jgi:hypothetical protein
MDPLLCASWSSYRLSRKWPCFVRSKDCALVLGPSWNIYRRLEERMRSIMELKAIGFKYLARGVRAS